MFAQVVDATGRVLGQHDGFPGGGNDATPWWEAGSLHSDRHRVVVAADAPAPVVGELRVGLYDRRGRMETISLGRVRVAAAVGPPVVAGPWPRFDDGIAVVSFERERTADGWRGTVGMTTDRAVGRSHTISVQLVGWDGLAAQDDRLARGGLYPTDAWRPGELVRHPVELKAPARPHRWLLVLYDLPEGRRVRAGAADHVVLAEE